MLLPRILRPPRLRLGLVSRLHVSSVLRAPNLHTFKLADIGEGITECEVLRWAVAPSSIVSQFDLLCEVQSDKASVELTSPYDGVVKELLVKEGEVAKVGAGLCIIEAEAGAESGETEAPAKPPPAPVQETVAAAAEAESSAPSVAKKMEFEGRRLHPLDPSAPSHFSSSADTQTLATPSVRHYARTHGVDLARLAPGSGRAGRVERADVDAFLAASKSGDGVAGVLEVGKGEESTVVELGRTRAAMWRAMEKSLEVPHFGYSTTFDITALHALLPVLNQNIPSYYLSTPPSDSPGAWNPAHALGVPTTPDVAAEARYVRITYLPYLLKTLSRAMMEWPLFRAGAIAPDSSTDGNGKGKKLAIRPHADIALALATPTGLYAPVLRAVDTRSVYALASDVARLSARARTVPSKLTPADFTGSAGVSGATISVSNVGAVGQGTGASPVLVPGGGVAIVALGRAGWVWDVGERWWNAPASDNAEWPLPEPKSEIDTHTKRRGARRLHLPISWAADHRVVEGAELAAFVECWRGWVESPGRLVGEGV